MSVDPHIVRAWLAARSISRGLPLPVDDHGGWRVDSGAPDEQRRYLFATAAEGLRELGREIKAPYIALKLCAPGEALLAQLPARWRIGSDNWMMVWDEPAAAECQVPQGYRLSILAEGDRYRTVITDAAGFVAASGYAVEHDGVFIYDRIATDPAHRRRGLGTLLIRALAARCASAAARHVLTATPEGRALYHAMGWRDYSPYATAIIPPGNHP
ncbi:GNAT family N-acetyltransferase [Sphingomonas sp. ID0503]|uniref:GNAT family N-acetyltransferase n=1 Tax=Sphingomonas sp. ID0503 TaxID=3399691 RepID=UPI003AFA67CD